MKSLIRFGVSIEEKLLTRFDELIESKGYVNRSEAIRDLIRDRLVSEDLSDRNADSIGTLTLIYSHDVRELSDKLNEIQHHNHRIIVSTTHIHLDEHNCLEVSVIKGKTSTIKEIANRLISTKGVFHGKLVIATSGKELS